MEKHQIVSVSHANGAFMFTCACKADLCNGHWDASINGTADCYPTWDIVYMVINSISINFANVERDL